MYRVPRRLVHALAVPLSACLLLAGCMAHPTGYGGMHYRSIKDEPGAYATASLAVPKRVPARRSVAKPARPASSRRAPKKATLKQADAAAPEPTSPALPGCGSNSECLAQLKALMDNPNRDWIGKTGPPAAYANGTRLFAYRALRPQLTCAQLILALAEIRTASKTFSAPVTGVSARQAARVRALSSDVERELRAESEQRCKS